MIFCIFSQSSFHLILLSHFCWNKLTPNHQWFSNASSMLMTGVGGNFTVLQQAMKITKHVQHRDSVVNDDSSVFENGHHHTVTNLTLSPTLVKLMQRKEGLHYRWKITLYIPSYIYTIGKNSTCSDANLI